jgi:hypothetical protein
MFYPSKTHESYFWLYKFSVVCVVVKQAEEADDDDDDNNNNIY